LEKLEISKEQVKMVLAQTFATLEEMMGASYMLWPQVGWAVENARLEKDPDNHLKLTVIPKKLPKRYAAETAKFWKMSKAKSEFHITFPGKVISSSFPETNG